MAATLTMLSANETETSCPPTSYSRNTETAGRSSPARSRQASAVSSRGSIGQTRLLRNRLRPRAAASRSSALPSATSSATSAICTPSRQPFSSGSIENAKSPRTDRSCEIVNSVLPRKSIRPDGGTRRVCASFASAQASAEKGVSNGVPRKVASTQARSDSAGPKFSSGRTFIAASALYLQICAYILSPSRQRTVAFVLTGTRCGT